MAESRSEPTIDAHRFAPAAPEEEHVYGSCCPGWHTTATREDAIAEWVEFMRDRGVERVCCLLSGRQLTRTEADTGTYATEFGRDKVKHVPIADHTLADPETLSEEILPFLQNAVDADEKVVVHCLAGIGRTGHVLAAWLVYGRGYEPVDAIETVERMGRAPAEAVESGSARHGELYELLAAVA